MRYLISGYYGDKNMGDEAILAGILQEIGRRDPEADFTVLSFDPADTELRHGEGRKLRAISTSLRSPAALKSAMRTVDLLVSGGGSFLHEADFELHGRSFLFRAGKLRPVPYFLSVILAARTLGLPVMWYAQGLGPLHTRSARRLVATAASASQVVTWRDRESAELAYEVGVRAPVQLVVPDPAYALVRPPAADVLREPHLRDLMPKARYLAVCLRPWLGYAGYQETLGRVLEEVGSALDLEILLVPFHGVQDPPVCEALAARPGLAGRARALPPVASPAQMAAVLGGAEATVTMRLHGGILAATAGTPAVVVDYDPKTRAFAAQTGQTAWTVGVEDLESSAEVGGVAEREVAAAQRSRSGAAALAQAIADTVAHVAARRAALAAAVAPLRAEAGRTAALAVQVASRGVSPASGTRAELQGGQRRRP